MITTTISLRVVAALIIALWSSVAGAADLYIFTADWCGPCRAFKREYFADPTIIAPFGDNALLFDIDREPEPTKHYNVNAVPTFLIVEDGVVLRRLTGYPGAKKLAAWLNDGDKARRFSVYRSR